MGLSKRQQNRLTRRRQKAQRKTNKRRNKNKRGGRKSRVKRQRKRGGSSANPLFAPMLSSERPQALNAPVFNPFVPDATARADNETARAYVGRQRKTRASNTKRRSRPRVTISPIRNPLHKDVKQSQKNSRRKSIEERRLGLAQIRMDDIYKELKEELSKIRRSFREIEILSKYNLEMLRNFMLGQVEGQPTLIRRFISRLLIARSICTQHQSDVITGHILNIIYNKIESKLSEYEDGGILLTVDQLKLIIDGISFDSKELGEVSTIVDVNRIEINGDAFDAMKLIIKNTLYVFSKYTETNRIFSELHAFNLLSQKDIEDQYEIIKSQFVDMIKSLDLEFKSINPEGTIFSLVYNLMTAKLFVNASEFIQKTSTQFFSATTKRVRRRLDNILYNSVMLDYIENYFDKLSEMIPGQEPINIQRKGIMGEIKEIFRRLQKEMNRSNLLKIHTIGEALDRLTENPEISSAIDRQAHRQSTMDIAYPGRVGNSQTTAYNDDPDTDTDSTVRRAKNDTNIETMEPNAAFLQEMSDRRNAMNRNPHKE